ncbi:RNA-binding protein [Methylocapsa palsarum]|uniref:YlxR domain-containing protein n=1 Tax=Methylocapsa palsarum TaxID=1612308 RepID=A0A1I3YSB6_9HYPH|nr:RNA-binding protein [Methylocapsa palsarum]SFK34693.1 hypothetical protein SAMN05444581_106148 [Methylocapsa palsarum]
MKSPFQPDLAADNSGVTDLAQADVAATEAKLETGGFEIGGLDTVDPETGPERTCILTRAKGSPDDMIRFVVGPGAAVVPDIRRKLPGRGVWVTAKAERVAEAVARKSFARAFKTKVAVSEDLAAEIEALLLKDCLQSLSVANKAGQVVAGFGKVEDVIGAGTLAALIHALGCGEDGVRKLGQSLRKHFGSADARPRIDLFQSSQLDLALGRANVIHAALVNGAASEAFIARCRRLAAYRCGTLPAPLSAQGAKANESDVRRRPSESGDREFEWVRALGTQDL